jgi:hypothetical protein
MLVADLSLGEIRPGAGWLSMYAKGAYHLIARVTSAGESK